MRSPTASRVAPTASTAARSLGSNSSSSATRRSSESWRLLPSRLSARDEARAARSAPSRTLASSSLISPSPARARSRAAVAPPSASSIRSSSASIGSASEGSSPGAVSGARSPSARRRRSSPSSSSLARPASASARTLSLSCVPRSEVRRPHSAVRSRSRSANRSSICVRRLLTSARRASTPSLASRATSASRVVPTSSASCARSSSAARLPCSSRPSRSRRAWVSAACAWRFSGRRWLRASRSTSRALSRLSLVRSSLRCARRRRLRCLPSPAASSTSRRRSRGLEWTTSSTLPWLITECISPPRLASERISRTSASRQRAPLSRYSPSPARSRRRLIDSSENDAPPSPLSITTSTSAKRRRLWPSPPAKIMSCIV